MKALTTAAFQHLKQQLKALPNNRKLLTHYCREHGFHNPPSILTQFDKSSSIQIQGSLAV
ncbi:hypothetical protein HUO09_05680 [Vibrio sp. Y2-5]|uniref:hypothetical protein n=1 Tax=Vibrio TaxID=662 RepID=UPI00142D4A57|nr:MULTISPECIES: hypothetical protein [Vibrio]MBD0785822.1 hypothetical protein [Vibrio sp. Y2-5]NIY91142.1 hypothetical protein [Vibrio diazotrophicus]